MYTLPSKSLILFIIFFCDIITSKKLRTPGLDGLRPEKLTECGRCKVLTDSFNHWVEKTSRGKYEGGDAAWEESKLKSYARSEIRLVEIQEGLCSELSRHQDDCYMLSEETEQVLEKWWFYEDPNSVDLNTWLCIENLKYCCPVNHFGDVCTPCPLDKDNKICSGHGTCDGEGTRKGNGSCVCKRGYSGKFCEQCTQNFFLESDGSCSACHRACNGCSGQGPAGCHSCKAGWEMESNTCIDVDECSTPAKCKSNQFCLNKEGSFTCKPCDLSCSTCVGTGASNCTSCEDTDILWNGMCITKEKQSQFVNNTLKRLGLYMGLLAITLIISRTSKYLASVVVLIVAVFIYYYESVSNVHMLDVITNILHQNSSR